MVMTPNSEPPTLAAPWAAHSVAWPLLRRLRSFCHGSCCLSILRLGFRNVTLASLNLLLTLVLHGPGLLMRVKNALLATRALAAVPPV